MTGLDQRINDIEVKYMPGEHWFQNDIDFILDNSLSIGIRYEF